MFQPSHCSLKVRRLKQKFLVFLNSLDMYCPRIYIVNNPFQRTLPPDGQPDVEPKWIYKPDAQHAADTQQSASKVSQQLRTSTSQLFQIIRSSASGWFQLFSYVSINNQFACSLQCIGNKHLLNNIKKKFYGAIFQTK